MSPTSTGPSSPTTRCARFSVENGEHRVSVTETVWETTDYAVHSVVGIEPQQQYLLETEPGRLQSFDVVWDTWRGGWFHLYPDQPKAPGERPFVPAGRRSPLPSKPWTGH